MTIKKKSSAMEYLEELYGGSLTLGGLLQAIREGDEISQTKFAQKLKISRSHLCDIEKGRKTVSLSRAVRFAKILGYSETQFARLALQSLIEAEGLKLKVKVEAA